MKASRKLSLRREAFGRLESDELARVGGGDDTAATLAYGADGVVYCLLSTPTWCGWVCDLTDKCRT